MKTYHKVYFNPASEPPTHNHTVIVRYKRLIDKNSRTYTDVGFRTYTGWGMLTPSDEDPNHTYPEYGDNNLEVVEWAELPSGYAPITENNP